MNRRFQLGGGVTAALVLTLSSGPASLAVAQDEQLEEVVVTGSRIGRASDFESPSPISTFDREYIDNSGYLNLNQLLEKIPATGNGTFSTRGNNQDSTANGSAAVSLRGLGADATLVLVNGRRVAIGSFAESVTTNFVDINSIPVAAIERVEILKDGASAVYGSDAVAGVVNIVLRNNFEGLEFTVGYGDTSESDSAETTLSAIWGTGGDDGNVTIIFDYFQNDSLFNAERPKLATADQSSRGGQDFRSSRGFPGTFIVDGMTMVDPSCPPERDVGVCVFDYGPFNVLIPESERTGLMLLGNRNLGGDVELFTEIAVQHNNSIAQGAPTPLDDSAGLTVPSTHPNNPFVSTNPTIDVFRFRPVDAGPRQWSIETDNLRLLLGLRGEINDWNWEVAASRGRSESLQTGSRSQGWVRTDLLQAELNAGTYNIFGTTFNSPDVLDRIRTSLVRQGNSDLETFDATVSGPIFDMTAGPALIAAGVEYREESISDIPDDQFQRGLIFGTESVSAAAARDNWSAFVEFSFPLLENLELQVAGRHDDYSDFGGTTNPKVAVRWDINDQIGVRGSWGQGFRAPSLAQIGLGPSQESLFFMDTFGCAINPTYCATTDYLVIFSGNPDLEAEESETFNLGVSISPIDNLKLSFDYWDITQEKKIDDVPFGFLYNSFCNVQSSTVCVRGTPQPGEALGALQSVSTSFVNIGEQSASGVDLSGTYTMEMGDGTLDLNLYYAYLIDFDRVELDSSGMNFVTRPLAGEYEYPESRWSLSGNYAVGDWTFFTQLDYVGEFEDTPDIDFDGTLDFDTNTSRIVDSYLTVNAQVSYSGFRNTRLILGADNLFDEEPPFAIGDGDSDLYGYVQSQHSPRGMYWYLRANFSY